MDAFVLDRVSILDRLGGDEDIFAMMAEMYVADSESYCDQLAAALAAGDAPLLQREAHSVKGVLSSFSDDAGMALALAVEQQAKTGNLSTIQAQLVLLQARIREVSGVLAKV